MKKKSIEKIAISGLGLLTAGGLSLDSAWQSILAGERNYLQSDDPSLAFIGWNPQPPCPVFKVDLPDLPHDLPHGISQNSLNAGPGSPAPQHSQTRSVRMLEIAAKEALAQSGLSTASSTPVGVSIGSCTGLALQMMEFHLPRRKMSQSVPPMEAGQKAAPTGTAGQAEQLKPGAPIETIEQQTGPGTHEFFKLYRENTPAIVLGNMLNDWGFAKEFLGQSPCTACAAGTDAIGLAMGWLQSGLCEVAVVGGTEELHLQACLGFKRLGLQDPSPCKPFDLQRGGLNLGEGAGILVLESAAHLKKRGGQALAWLSGYGSSADAYHPTAPHPDGLGLRRAIAAALNMAGLDAEDIDFINAHATATPENDRVEGKVLRELFPHSAVCATKGYTGHTLGAAGAVEAVLTVQSLHTGILPDSAGFAQADPEIGLVPTTNNNAHTASPKQKTQHKFRHALSQSLAFGGNNSVLIFSREAE